VTAFGFVRTLATGLAWVAIAMVIALGSAGVIATVNHVPGTAARAELTWTADAEMRPALDNATAELQVLADEVDGLSATARLALTQMVAGDTAALTDTINAGTATMLEVTAQSRRLDKALAKVPNTGADWAVHVSSDLHHRYEELAGTVALTAGLEEEWAAFTGRALDAVKITGLLARHDTETAAAAAEGTAAHYRQALKLLDVPDATIAESRKLQERLAASTDVSTLKDWIDRNAAYDHALRDLYGAMLTSKGKVTDAVRAAMAAETDARARLPGDTRGLVVIMSDIAQGGLNQAVISIEEARGSLSAALDVQRQLQDGTQLPD